MNTYIQDKLDEFDKTIGGSGFYQDALGIENYKEIRNFLKQSLTDYHNHIVEKIYGQTIITTDDTQFGLHTDGYNNAIEDILSILQDTNQK